MLRKLTKRRIEMRFFPIRPGDTGLEVVDDQALGHTLEPKFSSWGKTELCQVLDVEPITLSGQFDNC